MKLIKCLENINYKIIKKKLGRRDWSGKIRQTSRFSFTTLISYRQRPLTTIQKLSFIETTKNPFPIKQIRRYSKKNEQKQFTEVWKFLSELQVEKYYDKFIEQEWTTKEKLILLTIEDMKEMKESRGRAR